MKKSALTLMLIFALVLSLAPTTLAAGDPPPDLELRGTAYYDAAQDAYVLTEEEKWQGGAVWFSQVQCNSNFSIELDFYTGHDHYTNSYGGADGICVAFYADVSKAGLDGGGLGFEGCGGYGIQLDTYYNPEHNAHVR